MAKLSDRCENALNETRILILGAEVLLGFQFRSTLEAGFDKLPVSTQYLKTGGLLLLLVAIGLLMLPGVYHRIVLEGEDTESLVQFTSRVALLALLPFALGLGVDLYVAVEKVLGQRAGVAGGIVGAGVALFAWYGYEYARRIGEGGQTTAQRLRIPEQMEDQMAEGTKLSVKINQVLTEVRVVLPGAQALLGFQFASMLVEGFDKLPESSKYVHLGSLGLIAVAIVLLMTPSAFHRIVEGGAETERFHRFASAMVLAAMVPLALGIGGDVYVVFEKVSHSGSIAVLVAVATVLVFYGMWFGLTLAIRARRAEEDRADRHNQEIHRLAA